MYMYLQIDINGMKQEYVIVNASCILAAFSLSVLFSCEYTRVPFINLFI